MSDPYQPQNQPPYQGQPAPYGQSYPPAVAEHPQGNMVLILGIVGIFVPVVCFVAWFMGNKVRKEIAASGQSYSNENNINIGRILGMVFSIITIVAVVFWIIFAIIVVVLGASSGS